MFRMQFAKVLVLLNALRELREWAKPLVEAWSSTLAGNGLSKLWEVWVLVCGIEVLGAFGVKTEANWEVVGIRSKV